MTKEETNKEKFLKTFIIIFVILDIIIIIFLWFYNRDLERKKAKIEYNNSSLNNNQTNNNSSNKGNNGSNANSNSNNDQKINEVVGEKQVKIKSDYTAFVKNNKYTKTKVFYDNQDVYYVLEFARIESGMSLDYKWYREENGKYQYFFGDKYVVNKTVTNKDFSIYLYNSGETKRTTGKYKVEVIISYNDRTYENLEQTFEIR